MNRKNLTAAVLAGLAGAAGIASTAQAVNVNPDGLGEVLIYPYYTVNEGNFTILSVVNTTGDGKAVKVRFLEGMNSIEVLDFNLYMSPYDVWAAAVVDDGDGGAALEVTDTTCTVPGIETQDDNTQEFITLAYEGFDDPFGEGVEGDGGPMGRARLREGYFEMIEMGVLTNGSEVDATHVQHPLFEDDPYDDWRPTDCAQLVDNWVAVDDGVVNNQDGQWIQDPTTDLESPVGGLFGGAAVINAERGVMFSYDARAIEGFSLQGEILHFIPGNVQPGLGSGNNSIAYVFEGGDVHQFDFGDTENSIDAVSAVFMHDRVMNEYNVQDSLAAMSEWVVTFPTKRDYVNSDSPRAPFTDTWRDHDNDTVNDGACELITLGTNELDEEDEPIINGLWDREEQTFPTSDEPVGERPPVFSPSYDPGNPEPVFPTNELCWEVNVIRFGDLPAEGDYEGPTEILGSTRVLALGTSSDAEGFEYDFQHGWAMIDMVEADNPNTVAVEGYADTGQRWLFDDFNQALAGLPVTGFWVLSFENGFLGDGNDVLANYGGLFNHKGTRRVSAGN